MSTETSAPDEPTHGIKGQEGHDGKWMRYLISGISVVFSLVFLYTSGFGIFDLFVQRSTFLLFSLVLVFLLYPSRDDILGYLFDGGMIAASIVTNAYMVLNYKTIAYQAGIPDGNLQVALGILLLFVIFEASRRTIGLVLPILAGIFIVYALVGASLPGYWGHSGNSISALVGYLYLTSNGVWSFPIGIASTYIITFVVFGAFLLKSGIGDLFINLSMRVAGRVVGGPAQVAVASSSLFGAVSGAAPANVATTGSITIPMMKSIGFDNDFAGAVETAASAGGLLMPPIMGAAVFLMVEFTGIPYRTIIVAALVPALLYYFGIAVSVYLVARQENIGGQSKVELAEKYPSPREELSKRGHMLVPITVLVALVLINYPVTTAAVYSVVLAVVVSWVRPNTRMTLKRTLRSLDDGGRKTLEIAMAVAGAGIIYAIVNLTGLGVKFSNIMLQAAEIHVILALISIMVGCIVLGMGLPATVAYLITAAVAAPGLQALGFTTLNAHLFIFYFAILATITPPVGLALYTAAAIAESHWLRTGIQGLKLTFAGFLIPYVFIWEGAYLLRGSPFSIVVGVVAAFIGVAAVAMVLHLEEIPRFQQAAFVVIGALLFYPSVISRLVGIAAFIAAAAVFFSFGFVGRAIDPLRSE
jgi:TRAP transporter 4TM/12TM fusion protein